MRTASRHALAVSGEDDGLNLCRTCTRGPTGAADLSGGRHPPRGRGRTNIGRAIAHGILREVERDARHKSVYRRIQAEAAARPGSVRVETPRGPVWMSPIEHALYEAMAKEGLAPVPQLCIEGYYVDFAFPDVRLAVEADGAAYHEGANRQRDAKRDWILKREGWTVQRFKGSTIHSRAANCAYVVKREVEGRRAEIERLAREAERRRQERRDAVLRPFRRVWRFLKRHG